MHRIYLHVVWTTRQRLPLITAERARILDRYIRITARHHRSRILAIGMVSTHVHLLLKVEPLTPLSLLVQALKGGSATVLNRENHDGPPLRWARGYSMHSVSAKNLDAVRAYLAAQSEHHPHERIAGWTGKEVVTDHE